MTGLAALVLVAAACPACLVALSRGDQLERLGGLEMMNVLAVVVLLLLADAFGRTAYLDVALVLALLSFAGSLVFARFFGRSL
jgi:multicomponent Na+:H+ antiporter subunit F